MVMVNTKRLVEAIREADAFALPAMNDGLGYLYNTVYRPMSRGRDVRLSELDFGAFDIEDVGSFSDLYSDVFEKNSYAAGRVASTLRSVVPANRAVAYV